MLMRSDMQVAVTAEHAPERTFANPPSLFADRVHGRRRQALEHLMALTDFEVSLTALACGAQTSVRHRHAVEDEFVHGLSDVVVRVRDDGEILRRSGGRCGHGGASHHLVNRLKASAAYIDVGDRTPGDKADHTDDDLCAVAMPTGWRFTHKNRDPDVCRSEPPQTPRGVG